MSPFPANMRNRWANRPEPASGEGIVYWHVLMSQYPQARVAAMELQNSLSSFPGLHMTPLHWLHMTTLSVGPTADIPRHARHEMLTTAQRQLRETDPIEIHFGKILYHPEAIMLAPRPPEDLQPLLRAAQIATGEVLPRTDAAFTEAQFWTPHMTVAYSVADQPAGPIIARLGKDITEQIIAIDSLSLVIQWGAERDWDWEVVGTAHLRAADQEAR